MHCRAHVVLARSVGFCFGVAGLLLSIFSAIFSAVILGKKPRSKLSPLIPPARPRRRRSIPTITMTRADDGDMNPSFNSRPSLYRSASFPELVTIPASSFLQPPTPERRKKRSVVKTLLYP